MARPQLELNNSIYDYYQGGYCGPYLCIHLSNYYSIHIIAKPFPRHYGKTKKTETLFLCLVKIHPVRVCMCVYVHMCVSGAASALCTPEGGREQADGWLPANPLFCTCSSLPSPALPHLVWGSPPIPAMKENTYWFIGDVLSGIPGQKGDMR